MAKDEEALAATLARAVDPMTQTGVVGSLSPQSIGQRLAGRYEILGLLGAGGMGSVYRAKDLELDEVVALKVLAAGMDASFLDRFRQEVKLARRVTHRNVARTFDIGEHDGVRFLTMELVEGEALANRLDREHRLVVSHALLIARDLCAGLAAAHDAGVVHRDLKPENILLGRDSRVVITDFGIARALAGGPSRTQGLILGTPAYMAPEQVEGVAQIDARADIYALGAILFEMVTGRRAWEGESPISLATARILNPPPDPRHVRPDLASSVAEMILRCMQRKPDDRCSTVRELALVLDQILAAGTENDAPPATASAPSLATASSASVASSVLRPHAPSGVTTRSPSPSGLLGDTTSDKTLAVLPLRNGGAPEDAYLADGLTEDIIDALSVVEGLRVRSRGAVVHLRGTSDDPRTLGRELDVGVVAEGSVRRAGDKLRVSVRLISVADGFQIWAKRFDRAVGEVLEIGDEAAQAIAEALTVTREQRAGSPRDPVVVDLYLRARHEYHQHWGGANARAVELFANAAALAPHDARVLGGYGLALMRRFNLDHIAYEGAATAAREMAARTLAEDPSSAEAHVVNAGVAWGFGDAAAAAREALAAFRLNPGLPEVHEYYGRLLLEAGRIDEALIRLRMARTLEPEMRNVVNEIARAYALLGDWAKYEETMGGAPEETTALNIYWLNHSRMATWRRDAEALLRIEQGMMAGPPFEMRPVALNACQMFRNGERPASLLDFFDLRAGSAAHSMRRRAFAGQLRAEIAGLYHDRAELLEALRFADSAQLMDLSWLERCPLLAEGRDDPGYATVHAAVKRRADAVLAILPPLKA